MNQVGRPLRCGFTIDSAHLAIMCDAPLGFPSSPSSSKLGPSLTNSHRGSDRGRRSLAWVLQFLHHTRLLIQIRVYSRGDKSNHWAREKGHLRGTQRDGYVLPHSDSSVCWAFGPKTRILGIHLFRLGLRVWGPIHASNSNPIPISNLFPQPTLRGRTEEMGTGDRTFNDRKAGEFLLRLQCLQPEPVH